MVHKSELGINSPDSAAVFASALSLWQAVNNHASAEKGLNLSECYNGMDQLMREVMRVASLFETWACEHVAFNELNDVWPYFLEDKFGDACMKVLLPGALAEFEDTDCLRVGIGLRLPIALDDNLPLPIDVRAPNPVPGSPFRELRIQTMRNSLDGDDAVPFTADDDPFDEEFAPPYFSLYGTNHDGRLEHIADRRSYPEILDLAQKLAPGVTFSTEPIFTSPLQPKQHLPAPI